jgi:hypothetical protein
MKTKVGRTSAKALIKEVIKFCKDNGISASDIVDETGYTNAARLLRGDLITLTNDNEGLLRMWLADRRAQPKTEIQLTLPFDGEPLLRVPVGLQSDTELDLMQALAFVVDHYRTKLRPDQLGRAVAWVRERC